MSFQNDRITSIPAPLPLDYDRQYSFTNWETTNPGVPHPASGLEAEFNAIQQALDETQARARLIQDDDGSLLNESVGNDQLKSEVLVGVNAPTVWAPVTSYAVSDTVFESNIWYYCLTAHVSDPSSFATDLGTGKWRELLDLTSVISVEAQNWANHPEDSLVPEGDLVDDYSALHHANKSAASAAAASASAAAAASSAADAAADAATIPAPAGGSNGDLIQINSGGTAYEITTPASTNTPSTIVKRNGSGNFQAADPSAAQDVATKNWTEGVVPNVTTDPADDTDNATFVSPKQLQRALAARLRPTRVRFDTSTVTTITGNWSGLTGQISGLSSAVNIRTNVDYVYINFVTSSGTLPTDGWKLCTLLGGDAVTSFNISTAGLPAETGTCEIYVPSSYSHSGRLYQMFTNDTGTQCRISTEEIVDGEDFFNAALAKLVVGGGYDSVNGVLFAYDTGNGQYFELLDAAGTARAANAANVMVF